MISTMEIILSVCIIFAAFLLTCGALLERRYCKRTSMLVAGGFLLGVLALQAGLLLSGQDATLVLTLLPLTAYLPVIVCVHLLSANGFLKTCAVWTSGLLVYFTLSFWQKLTLAPLILALPGRVNGIVAVLLLAAVAAGLLAVVFRMVRAPFRDYVRQAGGGWLILVFPVLVVFLLLSYFSDSAADSLALVLVLLTALSLTLTLARSLSLTVRAQRNQEAQEAIKRQMALQRQDYEVLNKKMELGRAYRHDLRHHLNALDALLRQNQAEQASAYIDRLGGQLTELEQERWCENATVNAVLMASIGQARQAGCTVDADIRLPGELPFDELDLCVIVSNALENAVRACQAIPAPRRQITLSAALTDGRRLTVCVGNPWDEPMRFDAHGFPEVPLRKGHGIGLRSVEAMTQKYNGLFHCDWAEGQFTLKAVLFDSAAGNPAAKPGRSGQKAATAFLSVFLCVFFLNCMPTLAQALEEIPVVGQLVRFVDLRTWSARWGSTEIQLEQPVLEGDGAQAVNEQIDAWIAEMEETFLWYVSRKFEGYVSLESSHNILRDDDDILCLNFFATVNVGGSVEYSRCIMLDKKTGQILKLADLFAPDSDYVSVLSEQVRSQMERQMDEGAGDYFLPGGTWPDEECFHSIDPDQNFYVDGQGNLTLIFEEYTVAPGSMGTPQFVIAPEALSELLA